jgi:hypothetical protein
MIAGSLWPNATSSRAYSCLRAALSRLRDVSLRALEVKAVELAGRRGHRCRPACHRQQRDEQPRRQGLASGGKGRTRSHRPGDVPAEAYSWGPKGKKSMFWSGVVQVWVRDTNLRVRTPAISSAISWNAASRVCGNVSATRRSP